MHHASSDLQACIDACLRCHSTCLSMAMTHCLEMGGEHVAPDHFRLMMDCADICRTSADFMLRASAHHAAVCGVCADICEACAADCEWVGDMDDCVAACRACAQHCRQMAMAA